MPMRCLRWKLLLNVEGLPNQNTKGCRIQRLCGNIVAANRKLQVNWRKQAITLKFRLLSVRATSGASVSNRKMSVMAMLRQSPF
jgi:hypothetical protein